MNTKKQVLVVSGLLFMTVLGLHGMDEKPVVVKEKDALGVKIQSKKNQNETLKKDVHGAVGYKRLMKKILYSSGTTVLSVSGVYYGWEIVKKAFDKATDITSSWFVPSGSDFNF